MWDYALRMRCSPTELEKLKCIILHPPSLYRNTDWIEEQQFPQIHNIVLGRCNMSLTDELHACPDAVFFKDAMGRTALDWATARGQLSDIELLIERGSPLNTMDDSGRTTVLHAVDSHNDDALRLVLNAGAEPNPEVPRGLYRSSPLTAASFGGRAEMVKLLLASGAKVDACNPEGRTALHTVASMHNDGSHKCAVYLLSAGANMYHPSRNGHSPLTTAIAHNNHDVLKLFVGRCDTSCLKGSQLLPFIAQSADVETMSILAALGLLKQTLDENDFVANREALDLREDYNEALGNAFENLWH